MTTTNATATDTTTTDLATTATPDKVAAKTDPNTLLGVALGFAGVLLIAKEKLFLGALSLVSGALIGLQSHAEQQQGTPAVPPKKTPTTSTPGPSTAQTKPLEAPPKTSQPQRPRANKATRPAARSKKAPAAGAEPAKPAATGKLNQIEGIGPKIAEVLEASGIQTLDQMARATPEELREILAKAGNRFRLADPSTWPEQATLAAAGKGDELRKLQAELKGGRRRA